jgi:acetyltransferase-like isoleucine patch superfamily enzyme
VATVWSGDVWIGDDVILGYFVKFLCGHHDYTQRRRKRIPFPTAGYDITIKAGAWVASDVTLIGPCVIGEDAVVCAGSTVIPGTQVPAGEMWGGYPARFIKNIQFKD